MLIFRTCKMCQFGDVCFGSNVCEDYTPITWDGLAEMAIQEDELARPRGTDRINWDRWSYDFIPDDLALL